MAKFLVSCRANLKAVDIAGRTPEDIAERLNFREMLNYLKTAAVQMRRRSVRVANVSESFKQINMKDALLLKKKSIHLDERFTKLQKVMKKEAKEAVMAWGKHLKMPGIFKAILPDLK